MLSAENMGQIKGGLPLGAAYASWVIAGQHFHPGLLPIKSPDTKQLLPLHCLWVYNPVLLAFKNTGYRLVHHRDQDMKPIPTLSVVCQRV